MDAAPGAGKLAKVDPVYGAAALAEAACYYSEKAYVSNVLFDSIFDMCLQGWLCFTSAVADR